MLRFVEINRFPQTPRQEKASSVFLEQAFQSHNLKPSTVPIQALKSRLASRLTSEQIIDDPATVDRLSKDFYWYSPVLKRLLESKQGEIAVTPRTLEEVSSVLASCFELKVPVTVRGSGTGNYGQSIPLHRGLVLDLSAMDAILEIDADRGVARCQPGARLMAIEEAARKVGWELRCYPSTVSKASVGGFLAGGSGGIGSITYGGLREKGNVISMTMMTVEKVPRQIRFEGEEIMKVLHAYGTNGVIVEVELGLGPRVEWAQIAAEWEDFGACLEAAYDLAREDGIRKRLVTCFESPIPSYFKPIKKYLNGFKATGFFEVENSQLASATEFLVNRGAKIALSLPENGQRRTVMLSDFTWNHTTLWAIKADPSWTYLQVGFDSSKFREQMAALKAKYGEDFLLHLEFVKSAGQVSCGSIPVVRFSTEERLQEMIETCESLGVGVANPHTFLLGCTHRSSDINSISETKAAQDPDGLLNPGKLFGYPLPEHLSTSLTANPSAST